MLTPTQIASFRDQASRMIRGGSSYFSPDQMLAVIEAYEQMRERVLALEEMLAVSGDEAGQGQMEMFEG